MSEWISVEDHLPQLKMSDSGKLEWPSNDVLVITNDMQCYVGYYTKSQRWQVQETGCGCCSDDIQVTHWMPLPEPPND